LVPSSKPKKHFTPKQKSCFYKSVASLWRADQTQTGKKKKKTLQQVMSRDEWRENDGWMRFRCESLVWILLLT
jgi:hypothetical protein